MGVQTSVTDSGGNYRFPALPSGTYTYPTDPKYGGNAANLIEFRLKLTQTATAFRATFNTMIDPTVEAFTIAGDPDALIRLRVRDLDHLKRVVDTIRRSGRVTGTKTLIVLGVTPGAAS